MREAKKNGSKILVVFWLNRWSAAGTLARTTTFARHAFFDFDFFDEMPTTRDESSGNFQTENSANKFPTFSWTHEKNDQVEIIRRSQQCFIWLSTRVWYDDVVTRK